MYFMESNKEIKEQEPNYKDLYIRLLADTQNQKRRNETLYQNAWSAGSLNAIKEFIDMYNNLVACVDFEEENAGVKIMYKLLVESFEKLGVEIVFKKDIINTPFNVDIMDAITTVPVNDPSLDNCVVGVTKDGFKYNDTMVQYAQVVVGKYN